MIIANWKSNIIDIENWFKDFNNVYKPRFKKVNIGIVPIRVEAITLST